jgi:hypothetical protein
VTGFWIRENMPQLDDRYRKDANIVSRPIAGEMLLVPIRQKRGDLESIYTLNDTASRAWDLLDGQRTLGEISDQIVAEFEVDESQAEQDLIILVEKLEAVGAAVKA